MDGPRPVVEDGVQSAGIVSETKTEILARKRHREVDASLMQLPQGRASKA